MNFFQYQLGRMKLVMRGKNKIMGWNMTLDEVQAFFASQHKTVLTFFGYSKNYENEKEMLEIVKNVLSKYKPETTLVNIGGTNGGMGSAYPLAKSLGFTTTGITSTRGIKYKVQISEAVDYVCFIKDAQWGGKLPSSNELSPTSKAMVLCSDVLVSIGGGKITRDELLYGKELGKSVEFYSAEHEHQSTNAHSRKMDLPTPESFLGDADEIFGNTHKKN